MIRIITDSHVQSALEGVVELAEVRSAEGKLLGFFSPACPETARMYAKAASQLRSQDVLERRQASEQSFSTEQVIRHLASLDGR